MQQEIIQKYGNLFYQCFKQLIPIDGEDNKVIKISELEGTLKELFFSIICVSHTLFTDLTNNKIDLLQFSYFVNNIIVENLMEEGYLVDPPQPIDNSNEEENEENDVSNFVKNILN